MMTHPHTTLTAIVAASAVGRVLFPQQLGRAAVRKLICAFEPYFEGIRAGRAMAARYDEFARMSKAELARRGMTRDDISQIVAAERSE